jgi:hypothetical protein
MSGIVQAAALFLALVLAAAAVHKLVARERLATATGQLLRLQPPLAMVAMLAAAAIEAVAAIALVMAPTRPIGALLAALLWLGYGAALLSSLRRGDAAFDCGCSFTAQRKPVDRFTVARPFALMIVAGLVAVAPEAPAPLVEPVFAALALYTLLLAAGEIAALPTKRSLAR